MFAVSVDEKGHDKEHRIWSGISYRLWDAVGHCTRIPTGFGLLWKVFLQWTRGHWWALGLDPSQPENGPLKHHFPLQNQWF